MVHRAGGEGRQRRHPVQGEPTKTTRAFDKDVVADVELRAAAGREATAPAPRRSQLDRPAAGKTGTAALRPDTTTSAWFVGYTPQLSAAVDFYKGTGRADLDGVGGLPRSSAVSTPRGSGRRS